MQAVLNYIQTYLLSATGERAVAGLRRELFGKLLEMPPGFFADRRTGELTSRLSIDIGLLQASMSHQIAEFARQGLSLVGSVIVLFLMQWRLMLTTLGVVPVVVASGFFFGRRLKRITTGVQDQVAGATAVAEEAFTRSAWCRGLRRKRTNANATAPASGAWSPPHWNAPGSRALFFGVLTFTAFGGVTAVLWQGGRLVLAGDLTAGALVAFLLYTVTIAAAIGALTSSYGGVPGSDRRGGAGVPVAGDAIDHRRSCAPGAAPPAGAGRGGVPRRALPLPRRR